MFGIWSGAEECKSGRSRKLLNNVTWLAIVVVHTVENGPSKVRQVMNEIYRNIGLAHLKASASTPSWCAVMSTERKSSAQIHDQRNFGIAARDSTIWLNNGATVHPFSLKNVISKRDNSKARFRCCNLMDIIDINLTALVVTDTGYKCN